MHYFPCTYMVPKCILFPFISFIYSLIVKKDKFYRVSIIGSNWRILIIFVSPFLITSANPHFERHCSNPHPLHSLVFLVFIDTCLPTPKIDINNKPKVNKMGKTSCGIRPIELTATRQNATVVMKLCLRRVATQRNKTPSERYS